MEEVIEYYPNGIIKEKGTKKDGKSVGKWFGCYETGEKEGEVNYKDGRPEKSTYWYKNGKIHRDNDKPAVEWRDFDKFWYKNGKLHRDNELPAIIYVDGNMEWWKNDVFIKEHIVHVNVY